MKSGKKIRSPLLVYSAGRIGATNNLAWKTSVCKRTTAAGLKVNENFQTALSHIYAVGDVVGFPALASTSMQQGRHAACHAFSLDCDTSTHLLPYGIYAIPEISMVGRNEEELTRDGVSYEIGVARYREIARGQIIGDTVGMLKLLVHTETRELLGIHVIGEGATELIHIGQAVMALGGKLDYFVDTVFNYPTLAECYKVAALAAMNKLSGQRRMHNLANVHAAGFLTPIYPHAPSSWRGRQKRCAPAIFNWQCKFIPSSRFSADGSYKSPALPQERETGSCLCPGNVLPGYRYGRRRRFR